MVLPPHKRRDVDWADPNLASKYDELFDTYEMLRTENTTKDLTNQDANTQRLCSELGNRDDSYPATVEIFRMHVERFIKESCGLDKCNDSLQKVAQELTDRNCFLEEQLMMAENRFDDSQNAEKKLRQQLVDLGARNADGTHFTENQDLYDSPHSPPLSITQNYTSSIREFNLNDASDGSPSAESAAYNDLASQLKKSQEELQRYREVLVLSNESYKNQKMATEYLELIISDLQDDKNTMIENKEILEAKSSDWEAKYVALETDWRKLHDITLAKNKTSMSSCQKREPEGDHDACVEKSQAWEEKYNLLATDYDCLKERINLYDLENKLNHAAEENNRNIRRYRRLEESFNTLASEHDALKKRTSTEVWPRPDSAVNQNDICLKKCRLWEEKFKNLVANCVEKGKYWEDRHHALLAQCDTLKASMHAAESHVLTEDVDTGECVEQLEATPKYKKLSTELTAMRQENSGLRIEVAACHSKLDALRYKLEQVSNCIFSSVRKG